MKRIRQTRLRRLIKARIKEVKGRNWYWAGGYATTTRAIATACGMHPGSLTRYLNGRCELNSDKLELLLATLGYKGIEWRNSYRGKEGVQLGKRITNKAYRISIERANIDNIKKHNKWLKNSTNESETTKP